MGDQDFKKSAKEMGDKVLDLLGRAQLERTGLAAAGIVVLVALVITAPLYPVLGMPGQLVQQIPNGMASPDCAYDGGWFCGAKLAFWSVLGALVVASVMFLLRRQIRKGLLRATDRLPKQIGFLPTPVVAAIVFTMGWASVEFHFFDRDGIVRDGFFPVVVALLTYVTVRYAPWVQRRGHALLQQRDRVPRKGRFALLFLVPFLLGLLIRGLHNPVRDQLVVTISILAGWLLLLPARGDGARAIGDAARSGMSPGKNVLAAGLVLAAMMAVPTAVALGHCTDLDSFTSDIRACEVAHHSSMFSTFNGVIGLVSWLIAMAVTQTSSNVYARPPAKPGSDAAQAQVVDPDAPHGRDGDGWPLGPDGRRVPADWEGDPMVVSDGSSYFGDDGKPIPAGHTWYMDPDGEGHWLPREEAERITAEERADAAQAERDKQAAHERTMGDYEERKEEHGRLVDARDQAEAAEGRSRWDRIRELGERLRRRDRAEAQVLQGEEEQAMARRDEEAGSVMDDAMAGIGRDVDTLVSYETARQVGIATREGLDAAARELTDKENWRVAAETVGGTVLDAGRLFAGDAEIQRHTAENLGRGIKAGAQIGGHMATHPVETASAMLGLDNWARAMDPDVPVRERVGRALYGAVDAGLNFGGGAMAAADKVSDMAQTGRTMAGALDKMDDTLDAARASRTAAGVKVADGVEDTGQAARELQRSADALYEPKTGGAVWDSAVPGGQDPIDAGRAALARQAADDVDEARRALDAANDSGDAAAVAAAQARLEAAEDAKTASDRVADSMRRADADGARAGKLDRPKGAGPDELDARRAAQAAEEEAGRGAYIEFKTAEAEARAARASGDAARIEAAEARLHRATMEAQRNKTALSALKNSGDETKTAFNNSLRDNLYNKVDDDVVRWAEQRFGTGKTRYIGEAEPGLKVFIDDKGNRIMVFEPTNPKPGMVSVGADRDFVLRVGKMEDGKLVVRDVPSHETRAVYERSVYNHSRAGDYWPDESADDVMHRLDQMVTDARHREAYGSSPAAFRSIINDPSAPVSDPGQLSGVVADKSNHWYNEAMRRPQNYEEMMGEGMRQTGKQWGNQIMPRVEHLRGQGIDVRVPDDLQQAIDVMGEAKRGVSNVDIEARLAGIQAPGGAGGYTPRVASQRAAEFWGELEKLRPPPKGGLPTTPPKPAPWVAMGRASTQALHDQEGGS